MVDSPAVLALLGIRAVLGLVARLVDTLVVVDLSLEADALRPSWSSLSVRNTSYNVGDYIANLIF